MASYGRSPGQGSVEFALTIGIALLLLLTVVDFGRMVAMQAAVVTASREAARYGSAVGDTGSGTERYRDCAGIRQAARNVTAGLITMSDGDIVVSYDHGPSTAAHASCPVGTPPAASSISSLDRVIVRVTLTWEAISPVGLVVGAFTMTSVSRRTIVKAP
jgi:Flp pilus assembly protein TadG